MTPYDDKLGECTFLSIYDDGEDSNGIHYDDYLCEKHHIWLDSTEVCLYCKAEWTKEQIEDFEAGKFRGGEE